MTLVIINNTESDILDLYNVDYVCKVTFVPGEYRIEELEEVADVKDQGEK